MKELAVFVNSSDGFKDCWGPFFRLFQQHARSLRKCRIYLNTERKSCSFNSLDIISTKVWPPDEGSRPTWSECTRRGVEKIEEPFVLYLQEDYFLTAEIRADWVKRALALLNKYPEIGVVYLNRYGPQFRHARPLDRGFVEILSPASYLISTQAAVWRKEVLSSTFFPWENGWMHEKFGSWRARSRAMRFASVNIQTMSCDPVIDYIYTGVIKGKWHKDCADVFAAHNISIDFNDRGFYTERGRFKSRIEVMLKLLENPLSALRSIRTLV